MAEGIDLDALERQLAPLSHGTEALLILREALGQIGKRARQAFLNQYLLRQPIEYAAVSTTLDPPPEPFRVLQGDIIRTEAAYVLGTRQRDDRSFAVATATCDAVAGRRETALLLPVEPRRRDDYADDARLANEIGNLIAVKTTRYFYLPPLLDDPVDVLFNIAFIDPIAQCSNEALQLAERHASMTLLGWRVFGAMLRNLQVREAVEEVAIRNAGSGL